MNGAQCQRGTLQAQRSALKKAEGEREKERGRVRGKEEVKVGERETDRI